MSFLPKPIITFNEGADKGVNLIPINSYVHIHSDGTDSRFIYVTSVSGFDINSTVTTLLASSNYVDILINGNLANVNSSNYVNKSVNYTALIDDFILMDSSTGTFTITLPSSPSAHETISFIDVGSNLASNNVTIARNNKTIMGLSEDLMLDVDNISFTLFYTGSDWRIM